MVFNYDSPNISGPFNAIKMGMRRVILTSVDSSLCVLYLLPLPGGLDLPSQGRDLG